MFSMSLGHSCKMICSSGTSAIIWCIYWHIWRQLIKIRHNCLWRKKHPLELCYCTPGVALQHQPVTSICAQKNGDTLRILLQQTLPCFGRPDKILYMSICNYTKLYIRSMQNFIKKLCGDKKVSLNYHLSADTLPSACIFLLFCILLNAEYEIGNWKGNCTIASRLYDCPCLSALLSVIDVLRAAGLCICLFEGGADP